MTTNPPPCYHCGLRPAMLPIAYCADCYRLTGARLLTAAEVAAELGLDRSRIHQLSRLHGIGLPAGPRNTRLYTPAMVETLRTIRRPGGRPVTTHRYTMLRSMPSGDTYAGIISRDGQPTASAAKPASRTSRAAQTRHNLSPTLPQNPLHPPQGSGNMVLHHMRSPEMTSTETAVETRTIVYETHPDGSPALWLETASDGTRTLIDDGKTPVVLYPGEDVDEAVAQWRVAVGAEEAERDAEEADRR